MQFFETQITVAKDAFIADKHIILDIGIGFGKRLEDNLQIFKTIAEFKCLGCPILIGASRKSCIKMISGLEPKDRLKGTIAENVLAVTNGCDYVRVHDVEANRRAIEVAEAILPVESK